MIEQVTFQGKNIPHVYLITNATNNVHVLFISKPIYFNNTIEWKPYLHSYHSHLSVQNVVDCKFFHAAHGDDSSLSNLQQLYANKYVEKKT